MWTIRTCLHGLQRTVPKLNKSSSRWQTLTPPHHLSMPLLSLAQLKAFPHPGLRFPGICYPVAEVLLSKDHTWYLQTTVGIPASVLCPPTQPHQTEPSMRTNTVSVPFTDVSLVPSMELGTRWVWNKYLPAIGVRVKLLHHLLTLKSKLRKVKGLTQDL